jgi:hypothetical protein
MYFFKPLSASPSIIARELFKLKHKYLPLIPSYPTSVRAWFTVSAVVSVHSYKLCLPVLTSRSLFFKRPLASTKASANLLASSLLGKS